LVLGWASQKIKNSELELLGKNNPYKPKHPPKWFF
jgi:hypothetical protein